MKKLTILAGLVAVLAVNGGNAYALDAKKFGPTTIYNPAPVPMPLGDSESIFPSII